MTGGGASGGNGGDDGMDGGDGHVGAFMSERAKCIVAPMIRLAALAVAPYHSARLAKHEGGVALNLLLRLVVRAVAYSPRAQHLFSEVNLWPKTIRSKLKEFSARRGDGQAP